MMALNAKLKTLTLPRHSYLLSMIIDTHDLNLLRDLFKLLSTQAVN